MFAIIDSTTGIQVGTASTLRRASNSAERRNQEWGCFRYTYRRIA